MKKIIALKILIILVVIFISINSVKPFIRNLIPNNFTPIILEQANSNNLDLNMALSHLYYISKNLHPTGSDANYEVKDYIINQLENLNVNYDIQSFNYTYNQLYNETLNNIKEIKKQALDEYKENLSKNSMSLEEGLQQLGYNNFDDYYKDCILNGKEIEDIAKEITTNTTALEYFWNKETNESRILNNILVKLCNTTNSNAKAVLFVGHYDSVSNSYGASDNGITIASILEMIRYIKNKNLNNNIYVLLTDGEEMNSLGAKYFNENNSIDEEINLVINIDNTGASGNLFLYQISNTNLDLIKNYFKSVPNENTYSFVDTAYQYLDCYNTDADEFISSGNNVLNLSLISNKENYHSENDTLYNIDKNAVNNMMKTITSMAEYYGNANLENISEGEKLFYFKIWDGFIVYIPKYIYSMLAVTTILISFFYIIFKIIKSKSIKHYFLGKIENHLLFILTLLAIISYIIIQDIAFLFILPILFLFTEKLIKNKKIKELYKYITFLVFLLISIQVFTFIYIVINYNIAITFGIIVGLLYIILTYSRYALDYKIKIYN